MAGVYGLIAVLTGAGGSFAQLSLYIYSVIALLALGWGLKAVKEVYITLIPSTSVGSTIVPRYVGGSQADPLLCPPLRR